MKQFSLTDRGTVRKENQDSALVTEIRARHCYAVIVCDGMGGVHGGKLASELAVSAYMAELRRSLLRSSEKRPALRPLMQAACAAANDVVYRYSRSNTEYAGMGTTLVAATIRGATAELLNVGDSRAYLITRRGVTQLTQDHSMVEEMVQRGEITREEARSHPQKNFITRAVGVDAAVEADSFTVKLHYGDRLLLCSDGLSNALSEETIGEICRGSRGPDQICRKLIQQANARGARDNITAAVVRY